MRKTQALLIAAALCAGVSSARAQAPVVQQPPPQALPPPPPTPARKVEFDEAVRQAIERNPTVALAATAIDAANALLLRAQAVTRPTVVGTINNTTLNSSRGFEDTVTQPQSQTNFGVTAAMPILAFTRWAQVTQAHDQVEVSTLTSADTRKLIAVATAETYLNVIAARRQVEVDLRALESARAHLDYATRRLEGGAGSRLNQLRAAQEVSGEEARLEATRLILARSQDALGVLLGDDGPVDVGVEPAFEMPAAIVEAEWMAARTDLRVEDASIRAADRVVQDAWKDWLPNANLSFTPQIVAPKAALTPGASWVLSIGLTQRIFDQTPKADTALKKVSLSQAKLSRSVVELQARSEIRLAQVSLDSFVRALASARLSADQAGEVLRITTSAFEVGATTNLEVIDAQRQARDAESTAALAEDAVRRARLELLVAIGRFPR